MVFESNSKRFAEIIFAIKEILLATPFQETISCHLIFTVLDQSTKHFGP